MQPILIKNKRQIEKLCKAHQVKSLYAFGSVVSNIFSDESDVDLLVSFKPMEPADYADNYFEMADKLEVLLKRSVDLVTDKSLKNPFFIESVEKSKRLLYG